MEVTIKIQNTNELLLLQKLLASFSGSLKIENYLNMPLHVKAEQTAITNKAEEDDINRQIAEMSIEPAWTIEQIEENYVFDAASVIGKWPGDEPIEQLIDMLNPKTEAL